MPLFTSSHISTLLRKAASAARYIPKTSKAGLTLRARTGKYLRQLANETFPSLRSDVVHSNNYSASRGIVNGYDYGYALEPVRLGTRSFKPLSSHARLHTAANTFRSAYVLPNGARGGRMVARTGMGAGSGGGRGFASFAAGAGAGQGGGQQAVKQVPMVLRAFASLLEDEERDGQGKLPRASVVRPYVYHPYRRIRGARGARRNRRRESCGSVCLSVSEMSEGRIRKEIAKYFPLRSASASATVTATASPSAPRQTAGSSTVIHPSRTITTPSLSLDDIIPLTTDTLLTSGTNTTLTLPLSPTLTALLDPTPRIAYSDASVGIAILSSIFTSAGLSTKADPGFGFSLDRMLGLEMADRIFPLLAQIDALGLERVQLGSQGEMGKLGCQVTVDQYGEVDMLRITFWGRSEGDVRALLKGKIGDWCVLSESRGMGTGVEGQEQQEQQENEEDGVLGVSLIGHNTDTGMSEREVKEMMEDWTYNVSYSSANRPTGANPQLIMPVLDASAFKDAQRDGGEWTAVSPASPSLIDLDTPPLPTPSPSASRSSALFDTGVTFGGLSDTSTPISDLDLDLDLDSDFDSDVEYSSSRGSVGISLSSSSAKFSSLLSQYSNASGADSIAWRVPPSQTDFEVESAISVCSSEDVIEGLNEVWETPDGQDQDESEVEQYVWAGGPDGYGMMGFW